MRLYPFPEEYEKKASCYKVWADGKEVDSYTSLYTAIFNCVDMGDSEDYVCKKGSEEKLFINYDIEIEARYPNSDEEFMSGFLWDYNPEGYTGPDDKILHGTLTFVKAEYGGHTYTTPEQVNALGGVYIWRDAERKDSYTEDREGVGEAQFPKGTMLTVKIIPDSGYQLVNFGLNGTPFETQEELDLDKKIII